MSDTGLLSGSSGLANLRKALDRRVSLHGDLLELTLQISKARQLFVGLVGQSKLLLVEAVIVLPKDGDLLEQLLVFEG